LQRGWAMRGHRRGGPVTWQFFTYFCGLSEVKESQHDKTLGNLKGSTPEYSKTAHQAAVAVAQPQMIPSLASVAT